MIDNIMLVITGTLHNRDTSELLEKCHPLGTFDSMATLCVATSSSELYRMVLVDTPLGPVRHVAGPAPERWRVRREGLHGWVGMRPCGHGRMGQLGRSAGRGQP